MDLAQTWVAALAGLEAGPALDGAAARLLAVAAPDEAAFALTALLRLSAPEPHEKKALWALCRAIRFEPPALTEVHRGAIHRAARSLDCGELTALFTEAQAELFVEAKNSGSGSAQAEAKGVTTTAATVGHRTQTARSETNRDKLTRLAADPDPRVIRSLLQNPRLTESLVVRIASRRPVPANVLDEVARSMKWNRAAAVRRAIYLNPYSPPALAVSILAGAGIQDLREVAASGTLHAAVRATARALLASRLPNSHSDDKTKRED